MKSFFSILPLLFYVFFSALNSAHANPVESLKPAKGFENFAKTEDGRSFHSDILYLQTMLSHGPVEDPRPVFLLVNAYLVANQQDIGVRFFEKVLAEYKPQMPDTVYSNYLAALAILRATYADNVFLLKRIGWVLDTFELLEEAREKGGVENPLVRWASGLIYAQVPWFFFKEDAAFEELSWLVDHPETEPEPGFYREAYYFLSEIYSGKGDTVRAEELLKISGYQTYRPHTLFMGWFSSTSEEGLQFSPYPWIDEIVPGRLFAVRGFGFSEIHFILSDDGKELISIDAGTQPFSMKAAHEFFLRKYPDMPQISAVLITHGHWDHIGGMSYLKQHNPKIKVYGRENFHATLERVQRGHVYDQFRSKHYHHGWVEDYRPDMEIHQKAQIAIGGTIIEFVPIDGGETEDAMLIHIPAFKTIFMGDSLMPFYGEPWVEEGNMDAAMETMDEVLRRKPDVILHGHYALNYLYSTENLETFRQAYEWLVTETRNLISEGYSIKEIVRMNLIAPVLKENPAAFISYVSPRNHIIARTADHMIGIWQENKTGREPEGLDTITSVEYGRMFTDYLDLSPAQTADAIRQMLDNGDNELALKMVMAAEIAYPDSTELTSLKEEAGDRLRAATQFLDPFRFVVYTQMINQEHKPMPLPSR